MSRFKKNIKSAKQHAGRNNQGRITVRHRGGGKKKAIRLVNYGWFGLNPYTFVVIGFEYDPCRSATLIVVKSEKGWFYILKPKQLLKTPNVITYIPKFKKENSQSPTNIFFQAFKLPGSIIPLIHGKISLRVFCIKRHDVSFAQFARSAGC